MERRVWQHQVSDVSADQLGECFHRDRWVVTPFAGSADYGEDFFVRIFHEGNPTRCAFYVQLEWHGSLIPVILILWDVERKFEAFTSVGFARTADAA